MRTWSFFIGVLLLIALVATPMLYLHRHSLKRDWTLYRVGAAGSSQEADGRIAACEASPESDVMIPALVHKWGSGNRQFDLYLALHVGGKSCGETLREAFAKELQRRKGLLDDWAHYWTWRAQLPPDHQMASVVVYHDALATAEPPRDITWRDVLDLQAIFQLTGFDELARDIEPSNWRECYAKWQKSRPAQLPRIARPEEPFPK